MRDFAPALAVIRTPGDNLTVTSRCARTMLREDAPSCVAPGPSYPAPGVDACALPVSVAAVCELRTRAYSCPAGATPCPPPIVSPVVHEELRDPLRRGVLPVAYGIGTTAPDGDARRAAQPRGYWTRLAFVDVR